MTSDQARHAPATARNRQPILDVLRRVIAPESTVLEVASGTGEHAAFLAKQLDCVVWQPSDVSAEARASIEAWRQTDGGDNFLSPLTLDASSEDWPVAQADAIVCINMVHISPWQATVGLFQGAARLLSPGSPLYLYGPYHLDDRPTAPSNQDFDASLRARNPEWGLRRAADLEALGEPLGLRLEETVDMPANNVSLVFRRQ